MAQQITTARRSEESKIFISSANSRAVNKDLFCVNMIDICVKGNPSYDEGTGIWSINERDILAATYSNLALACNFTSYKFLEGSTSDYAQVIVGETAITGGTGKGYNCVVPSCGSDAKLGGICCVVDIDQDFFLAQVELAKQHGKRIDLIINVQLDAPDWIDQADWMIEHCTTEGVRPKHVTLGAEQVLQSNDPFWGFPADCQNEEDYKTKVDNYVTKMNNQLAVWRIDHPDIIFHGDAQRPERMVDAGTEVGTRAKIWNNAMQGLNVQAMRTYFNSGDLDWTIGTDFDDNLLEINRVIEETMPFRLRQMRIIHKNKSLSITQWGIQTFGPGQTAINNTTIAMIFIARCMSFYLDYNYNTNGLIVYASYQNFKQLIANNDSKNVHYFALFALGKLFQGTPIYLKMKLNDAGVYGNCIFDDDANVYRVLLINQNGTTKTYSSLVLDNISFTNIATRYTVYGAALDSTTVTEESATSEVGISLRPTSLNILTFSNS